MRDWQVSAMSSCVIELFLLLLLLMLFLFLFLLLLLFFFWGGDEFSKGSYQDMSQRLCNSYRTR